MTAAPSIVLSGISIHPVKSCRRIELDSVEVSESGLLGDREWQIVDEAGRPVTQRQHTVLATIEAIPIGGGLRLSAPKSGSIEFARPSIADRSVQALLGDEVRVGDAGEDAASWLSGVIGETCRLVAMTPADPRRIPLVDRQPVSFVDGGPVVVASTSSLGFLQDRATEPFGMDRFRPNLVVDGSEPWVEDTWSRFSVGGAMLRQVLPWPRCAIPQIDQDTGSRHKEPARVLRSQRWCTAAPTLPTALAGALVGNALFGIACMIEPDGTTLRVGDAVTVEEVTEPVLAAPESAVGDPPAG